MIAEGVLALEYGASAEDIARTTHAHVRLLLSPSSVRAILKTIFPLFLANTIRGVPRSRPAGVLR